MNQHELHFNQHTGAKIECITYFHRKAGLEPFLSAWSN